MEQRTVLIKLSEGNTEKVKKIKLRRKKFKETVTVSNLVMFIKLQKHLVFQKNVRM